MAAASFGEFGDSKEDWLSYTERMQQYFLIKRIGLLNVSALCRFMPYQIDAFLSVYYRHVSQHQLCSLEQLFISLVALGWKVLSVLCCVCVCVCVCVYVLQSRAYIQSCTYNPATVQMPQSVHNFSTRV